MSPSRKRPEKKVSSPPGEDLVEKQDSKHTESDFLRDLARATDNDAKRKLAERAKRG